MITCNFSGNFGNAIIQYAITRTVAKHNGYKFGFNPKFNYDYHSGYNQLDFLDLDYGDIHNADFHELPDGVTNRWVERWESKTYGNGDTVDFHPYQDDVFDISDNTMLVVRCMQDARYYNKYQLRDWIKIKELHRHNYAKTIHDWGIFLDENTCVINVRGGEYRGIPHVLLQQKYWDTAIKLMKNKNPKMKFIVVSDDPHYAQSILPDYPVIHNTIGLDYYILNNAKNLIISNSSFAIMPVWLNESYPFVIAPMYWARHNVSSGYWASSDMWTFQEWFWLRRDGTFSNGK